jgi:aquaporin Z
VPTRAGKPTKGPRRDDQAVEAAEPARRLLAEVVGTFALTFVSAGAVVVAAVAPGSLDHVAKAAAPGLVVAAIVYTLGSVSGAHINPVATLAFALRADFPWPRVPAYWLAQLAGAAAAAAVLRALFGPVAHLGANVPEHLSNVGSCALEVVLTALLVIVILGTATHHGSIGPHAAIPVGATVALCGLIGGPLSGASMNPARSLGPALLGGAFRWWWIYVIGPAAGAAVAVGLVYLLLGPHRPEEETAAKGSEPAGA